MPSNLDDITAAAANGPQAIRMVIGEGNPILRAGLRSILAGTRIEVVGEAGTAAELLEAAQALSPAVVLLDMPLPGSEGLAALEAIREAAPQTALIVLSEDPGHLVAMLHSSVSILAKSISREELLAAVEAAAQGRALVDRAALLKAIEAVSRGGRDSRPFEDERVRLLTAREREVLGLLTRGFTNRRIAEALSIGVGTVKVHVCNILTKLGMDDRVQAAVWASHHGLGAEQRSEDTVALPPIEAMN